MITSDRSKSNGRLLPDWYEAEEAGMQVHWLPVPYSNKMGFKDRVKAFMKFATLSAFKASSLDGDVVFATSTPLTIALPGIYTSKINNIPMVFEVRDLWPELPIAIGALQNKALIAATSWLERYAYKSSSQVVALSPGMRDGILRKNYPEENVHVIPNSSDMELFGGAEEEGRKFREQREWLGDRPLIIYAGTLGEINGVSYLVKVAAEMIKMNPEVRFLIVGRGAEEQKIRSLAEELDVLNKNVFMPGKLPKKDMPAVFSAANISTSLFIDLPEMWANSANKFFDGLASGTPIAINYLGWQAEVLNEYKAGITLPPHNYEEAANKLLQKCTDDEWLSKAGQNARKLAAEKYDRDLLAQELEKVLLKAAS